MEMNFEVESFQSEGTEFDRFLSLQKLEDSGYLGESGKNKRKNLTAEAGSAVEKRRLKKDRGSCHEPRSWRLSESERLKGGAGQG
jgi:hypothetical protein